MELSNEDQLRWFFLRYGVPTHLKAYYEAPEPEDVPGLTFKTPPDFSYFVCAVLSNTGFLEYVNRNLMMYRLGLVSIRAESGKITFVISGLSLDHVENKFALDYQIKSASKMPFEFASPFDNSKDEILDHLQKNVFLYDRFGIGYKTTPELDAHFFTIALSRNTAYLDYGLFPDDVQFGGIDYGYYCLATTLMLALSLKHEAFCAELFRQNSAVNYVDILTITGKTVDIVETIMEGVNQFGPRLAPDFRPITLEQARQIFRVISLNKRNFANLIEVDMALPYLIELTSSSVIKSLAGARTNPFSYLRRSLRSTFGTDYDKAQNQKETYFYRALERVVLDLFPMSVVRTFGTSLSFA